MIPSFTPIYDFATETLEDGTPILASRFCRDALAAGPECKTHYRSLAREPDGFYRCPFGFTTRTFAFEGGRFAMTGVVAFPRFDAPDERKRAKESPQNKIARDAIDANIKFLEKSEALRANVVQEAAKVLPQAFHELRKLNGAVIQHAEREINDRGESRNLVSIKSAGELMRNNFDILEALSNIDVMRALPTDSTVNVFDLVFKVKRVLQEKAASRGMGIHVQGVRAIINGSQKSFPIVPAVLIENAIKYGSPNRPVRADITAENGFAILTVENQFSGYFDTVRCFERGVRFSDGAEGGGFGLYLAKEIVSCHKGTIRCDANGEMVKVTVKLPLVTVIE